MEKDTINILVSFDESYLRPYETMFKSLIINNPHEHFHIWVLHNKLSSQTIDELYAYTALFGNHEITFVKVEEDAFSDSPASDQYPREMYFRMLAPKLLPDEVKRVIYLDPDILVINAIREFWEMDIGDKPFAAASHTALTDMKNVANRMRLLTDSDYFNTGIILMNLDEGRKVVNSEEIYQFIENYKLPLILPDQDVYNHLFGDKTYQLNDVYYNFDPRYLTRYYLTSNGLINMDWVMQNTVIIHYCGKSKPWNKVTNNSFTTLYKHYMYNVVV